MGLETRKLSSLWKDQALVAINVAVIHSYQVQFPSIFVLLYAILICLLIQETAASLLLLLK